MPEHYPARRAATHRRPIGACITRARAGYHPHVLMPPSPTIISTISPRVDCRGVHRVGADRSSADRPGDDRPGVDRVLIVLPARDEAGRVADAIEAIGDAALAVRPSVAVVVMVVDHSSSDDTRVIARESLAALSERGVITRMVSATRGGVGTARHLGIVAMTGHWRRPQRAWVLSTDADSRVRPDWIVRYVRHGEAGAQAVAGVVDLLDEVESGDFRARWRVDYGGTVRSDGTHPHAHAANLGVRLDAYRRAGGFRDVGPADDRDLWRRLRAIGIDPVADGSIVVDTSGRRTGRVPAGFATALSTLYPIAHDPPAASGVAAGTGGTDPAT